MMGIRAAWRSDGAALTWVALVVVGIHLMAGGRFGFHRDELATLDDARRLAWGYVAYPPVTPFFARVSLELFGPSVLGFRLFAVLAQAMGVFFAGLMAREIGGGRGAQVLAAVAGIPFALAGGALMQYVSFDYLAWVMTAYFTIRMLKSADPRWWTALGAVIGVLSKYSIAFLVAGLGIGLLLTDARKLLASRWLWVGVAIATAVALPHLVWQARHDFITLDFLRGIHQRDIEIGRTQNFLPEQFLLTLFAAPLALAGLGWYFVAAHARRFRCLAWMYLVPLLLFALAKGRGYYMAAAYPMLYAAGSVALAGWTQRLRPAAARVVWSAAGLAVVLNVALAGAIALPQGPVNSAWWNWATEVNGDLLEEIGWPELAATVADVRDRLPPDEQGKIGILAGNYGEAGAINLYGPRYGLPAAISGVNSFYEHGYPQPPPQTLIVLGHSRDFLARNFEACEIVARVTNAYGVLNEETRFHPDIYVCRRLRASWPEFWKSYRRFG